MHDAGTRWPNAGFRLDVATQVLAVRRERLPDVVGHGLRVLRPQPRGTVFHIRQGANLPAQVRRRAVPGAVVANDAGTGRGAHQGRHPHPLGLVGGRRWRHLPSVGAENLPDRSVLPGEIAHGEIDGDHGRAEVDDAPPGGEVGFVRAVLCRDLDTDVLRRLQSSCGDLVGLPDVGVQMLVLDGTGQAEVAAGAENHVVRRAEYLGEDRRRGGQVHHGRPLLLVQHLARGGRGAVAVAMGEPAALGDVLARVLSRNLENLAQRACAAAAEPGQVLLVEEVADHHETVAAKDPGSALDFVRR